MGIGGEELGGRLRITWNDGGLILLIWLCCALCSFESLAKYLHGMAVAATLFEAVCIAGFLIALRWMQSRRNPQIHWAWLVAFWVLMATLYAIVYPISQRHAIGMGSDEEDALRIAATNLLQFHFPYYTRTYLGHPITPMPGAVALAVPFLLLGKVSLQNPVWLGVFTLFCARFFRFRSTALAYLLVIGLGGVSVVHDLVVGDDYTSNAFYICVAVFVFLRSFEENPRGWAHFAAGVFLGVALSSRPPYVVIPPLVLAYLFQRGKGTMTALRSFAVPILVAAAVTLPFYLYDPSHFSPLHIQHKLNFLPRAYRNPAEVLLPVLALLVACSGFFQRLTIPRLFLVAGIALAVILVPPGLIAFGLHNTIKGYPLIAYGNSAAILVALWAFSRFEAGSPGGQTATSR